VVAGGRGRPPAVPTPAITWPPPPSAPPVRAHLAGRRVPPGCAYGIDMPPRPERRTAEDYLSANGYQTVDDWLNGIRERRAAAPTKAEIQAAITRALETGMNMTEIARVTGIPRQQFYQGKYDLSANALSRRSGQGETTTSPTARPEA